MKYILLWMTLFLSLGLVINTSDNIKKLTGSYETTGLLYDEFSEFLGKDTVAGQYWRGKLSLTKISQLEQWNIFSEQVCAFMNEHGKKLDDLMVPNDLHAVKIKKTVAQLSHKNQESFNDNIQLFVLHKLMRDRQVVLGSN